MDMPVASQCHKVLNRAVQAKQAKKQISRRFFAKFVYWLRGRLRLQPHRESSLGNALAYEAAACGKPPKYARSELKSIGRSTYLVHPPKGAQHSHRQATSSQAPGTFAGTLAGTRTRASTRLRGQCPHTTPASWLLTNARTPNH